MAKAEKNFILNKKLESLINSDAYVLFDTNVLLSAYTWRKITMSQIREIMCTLKSQNRLKFSLQTLIEFNKNRQNTLKSSLHKVDSEISRLNKFIRPIELAPMLEDNKIFEDLEVITKELSDVQESYKQKLMKVKDEINNLFYEDEFIVFFKNIAKDNLILEEYSEDYLNLTNVEFKERVKKKIPPGYKDSSKPENASGDYIIWKDILSLDRDVIFVSNDVKEDWAITDNNKNLLTTNNHLVQEYFEESDGKYFVFSTPNEFIKLWNPNVDEEILTDVNLRKELFKVDRNEIISNLREVNLSYYPGTVTEAVFNIGVGKTLELDDEELRKELSKYFRLSIGDIEEFQNNSEIINVLEQFYNFNSNQVTDEVVEKARLQALEYIINKTKSDIKDFEES